ncbi:MAG: efflux RND transporter permease subunit [Planctomycetes bacterium]|nr:efflux RND transporter permease subunit [Planctomycetota bacterium]
MLDAIVSSSIRWRLLAISGGIVLLAAGAIAWLRLPIDAFPDVTNVQVMILTNAAGLPPGEVERLITRPIEIEMGGLPDVRQVRSLSRSGLSQVVIVFEDHADTYFARELVFQRLSQAREDLPDGIEPELGPISTGLGEIYQYALASGPHCPVHGIAASGDPGEGGACAVCGAALEAGLDLAALRAIQDWVISLRLRRIPGINEVNSFGGFVQEFHVVPDPDLLRKYDVGLREILDALAANNANAPGGFIARDWERVNVVSMGLLSDAGDIRRIVLRAEGGTPVYLGDVADVRIGTKTRNGVVTKDGRGEAVIGMTIMLKDANSKEVVDRVRAEIPEIEKSLPPGVRIAPFYDRTDLIQACIRTVSSALGQGMVLIVAVLFLLLWEIRAAFAVAVSLPLTAAAAFVSMGVSGVTANLMSLGGLAIAVGMVVDGSTVVIENIARHMREKADTSLSRAEIAIGAVREVARPVTFAILTIIAVFLPLFSLESLEGKMFEPLALTLVFALAGSLIITLTVIPALGCAVVRRRAERGHEGLLVRLFERAYVPVLSIALRGRWMTVAAAAALLAVAGSLVPRIGTEFLPPLDEGAFAINVVRLPTAGLEGGSDQTTEIERRLLSTFPEIATVVSKTGRAEIAEDPMGPEQSDIFVMFRPRSEWPAPRSREELIQAMREELGAFPGLSFAFSQPIALRVNELVSGIKSDVAVKIFGEDMAVLRAAAERIAPALSGVRGARDIKIEQTSGFSEIRVEMDREAMARHGVNGEDINLLIETAVGGRVATAIYEGERRFDVLVRFPEDRRADEGAIERLLVRTPRGYDVPLGDVADVREVDVPAQISREDFSRRMIVECNVRGRDLGGFIDEAKRALAPIEADLPGGYRLAWGGQFENQERAMARLRIVVPVALLAIFALLFTSLASFTSALLVLLNLPFALAGGVAMMVALGANLSVSSAVGFIALFGVAVENGLVLLAFFDQLRGRGMPVEQAVLEGCRLRLRPLLMTTLTTLLGLVPLLIATGAGSEIQRPLVAVVFGGLASALGLTLVILPVLYVLVHGGRTRPAEAA